MSEHLKVPKEAKQHGELNNHGSVPKVENTKVKSDIYNKAGSEEYTLPPEPIISADKAGITTMQFSDGRYVELDQNQPFSTNISMAYGAHGLRNGAIILAEQTAKASSVQNPYAMALIWLARVGLSTTKKMVVEEHGETYGFGKALIYGIAANTKLTTPGYFTGAFKGSEKFQKLAHASHELHHAIEKLTFSPISLKGSKGPFGEYQVSILNTQIGASQIEQKYFSGATIFYAIKGHGAASGNHGASANETHPQNKIENETHSAEVNNSHNAKGVEHHANAEPKASLSKADARDLLLELGKDEANRQVLWIAYNLNTGGGLGKNKSIDADNVIGGESVELTKVKITEDIAFAQELLKRSGLGFNDAVHENLSDIPNNLIKEAYKYASPVIDLVRFAWNTSGLGMTDAEEKAKSKHLNLGQITANGGTVSYNVDGSVTVKIDPKKAMVAKSDNTRLPTKVNKQLLVNVKEEKAKAEKDFAFTMDKIKAANIERQTGIKVGTPGNALPGQPFANNTPAGVGSTPLFRNSPVLIGNPGGNRTTIGPARNSFNK